MRSAGCRRSSSRRHAPQQCTPGSGDVDRLGHGAALGLIEQCADELAAREHPWAAMGFSMGGFLACMLAGEVSGPAAWSCMSCPMMSTSPAKSSPPVQIRNQARVHLWYEQKFGSPCPPHESAEAAIDTFEATTACLGVRLQPGGRWRIYAPHGLSDVFNLVVRPNCALAPRHVYQAKTTRWRRQWPSLTVVPWPQDAG